MHVIIIDSTSQEWDFLLEYHSGLQGNSFTNWNKVTPRHDAFVNTVLQAQAHMICTIRSKSDYILVEKNGKQHPEKVGLKGVQRESLEYEFTLVFEIDMSQRVKATKDRTGMFTGKPEFIPTIETGKQILQWCEQGVDSQSPTIDQLRSLIDKSKSENELVDLYNKYPAFQKLMHPEFAKKRKSIISLNNQNQPKINGAVIN